MVSDPEGFLVDLVTAVNAHDIEALVRCFSDDYVNETPVHPARSFRGADKVRANWSTIFGAVPDITASIRARAVAGDTIWSEWSLDGTRADGSPHHMRDVMIFEVAGRQATSVRFYLEPLDEGTMGIDAAVKQGVGGPPS